MSTTPIPDPSTRDLGDGWKVISGAPQATSAPAPAGGSRDLGDGWKVIGGGGGAKDGAPAPPVAVAPNTPPRPDTPTQQVPGMGKLGGVPPGIPPGPLEQIAAEARATEASPAHGHLTPEGLTARQIRQAEEAQIPGFEQARDAALAKLSKTGPLAEPFMPEATGLMQVGHGIVEMAQGPKPGQAKNPKETIRGATDVLQGGMGFLNTPAGMALAGAPAALTLLRGYTQSELASRGARAILEAYHTEPDVTNLVSTAAGAAGVAEPIVRSGLRAVDAGIESHNAAADTLLEQERAHGKAADAADQMFGGQSYPVTIDGKPHTVEYAQGGAWRVLNAEGKAVFGGKDGAVTEWLRSKGAAPATPGAEVPRAKEPVPIVRPASPAPASTETAPAPSAAPAAAPRDLGDGWTANPIEDHIAEQERAAIAERKAAAEPHAAPPAVAEKPQTVTPTEGTRDLGNGWTAVPAPPESEQAPPAAPATAPTVPNTPAPGSYANVPPSSLTLDPNRFQFKFEGIGQKGVTDQFKNVQKWNPNIAGTVSAWYDPANGETYPVNGHHRVELGQRLGDENVPGGIHIRYIDAPNAQAARAEGALINIGEGQGTALDVGKFLRDTGTTVEQLLNDRGIELHKKEQQQGAALANLTEPMFHDVVHGLLPVERAALIGANVPSHADQTALYTLMRQREASGQRMTNDQLGELIRMNQRAPTVTEKPGEAAQGSMFDLGEMTRSLLPEKAIVSDYVRGQLKSEKKLFGAVSSQAAAERLGEAGNVIQASTNAAKSEAANQGIALYDKLSTSAGPIDGILDRAAQSLAKGQNANDVKQAAYREVGDHLTAQLQTLTGGSPASGGQPQAVREGRLGEAGPGELNPLDARGTGVNDTSRAGQVRSGNEEKPESGDLFGNERGSLSLKSTRTPEQVQAARDKQYGQNMREWFTARRDLWSARVRQQMDLLRKGLPDHVDREGLFLMRDMRHRPGELAQYLAGTHEVYGQVPRLDLAQGNIQKLRPAIERAMSPTPAMLKADSVLTRIAEVSLREGQRLGFIEHHVSPDEYVTHLLEGDEEKKPSLADRLGKAMGGKIGRNFPFNQERAFPTILEAIAHNQRPQTLDALKAFDTYGDKFATARATHLLIQQLRDSDTGIWGTRGDKGIPKDWVEIAPHAHPFRNLVAYTPPSEGTEQHEPVGAYQTLFVPKRIEQGLRPITDPDYSNKIAGFSNLRMYQAYTKAAQLGLSFFHATTENFMALSNMGARGWLKALKADHDTPEFHEAEARYIAHGLTTSVQGRTYEAAEGLTLSSLPTAGEAWRSMAGARHVIQAAKGITDLTFGKLQRQFKVIDMATHESAWMAQHPQATQAELSTALRSMAKEVNAAYGGLHQENLGINRITANVARALMLAPDWTFSNVLNLKYAAEGTPGGKMARMFWLRAIVGGMAATQMTSLLMSRKLSKRPTQVFLGTDPDGKDVYQNLFFKGAPGDLANAIGNIKDYGAVEGLFRTVGNKAAPVLRTGIQAVTNRNFLGREIVPHGMNPIAGTVRGAWEAGKSMAPIPWSLENMVEMLFGPDAYKYKKPTEVLTTLFAGTPPTHVGQARPEKESQNIWQQIVTGKTSAPAPRSSKPPDPVQQIKREQRKLLHP